MTMIKRTAILVGFAALSSCGTPEYQAEQSICTATWMNRIPPRMEQEIYNETKTREVPTGRSTCTGTGNTMQCIQEMKTEYYSVPAVRTVDRNEAQRDVQIRACTVKVCQEKYGNGECKPAE
ncbi:MAG: hypothetical protein VX378_16020 [Pseudomonadota bacterium]|nr:hypothetical protein [Pseudomonadota bacterium]